MKKDLEIIIFLGAIWGIIEATLGYLLHATSFAVGGSILFPIGFYIMKKAYNASGNLKTIFLTSVVASLIKLVDLAMPVTTIYKVINPAISILFEGLIVLAVYYVIQNKEKFSKYKSLQALALGLGWRTMYLAYLLFLPANIIKGKQKYAILSNIDLLFVKIGMSTKTKALKRRSNIDISRHITTDINARNIKRNARGV